MNARCGNSLLACRLSFSRNCVTIVLNVPNYNALPADGLSPWKGGAKNVLWRSIRRKTIYGSPHQMRNFFRYAAISRSTSSFDFRLNSVSQRCRVSKSPCASSSFLRECSCETRICFLVCLVRFDKLPMQFFEPKQTERCSVAAPSPTCQGRAQRAKWSEAYK